MNYAFFGHHKCASTWATHISYELCNHLGFKPLYFKTAFEEQSAFAQVFKKTGKPTMLISQSSAVDNLHLLERPFRGFHIIRDPRDLVVSGYFSHLKTHAIGDWTNLETHRSALTSMEKDEGLLKEFEFSAMWLRHLDEWNYDDPNIFETKMETLTADPLNEWRRVVQFLGLYDEKFEPTAVNKAMFDGFAFVNRATKYWNLPEALRPNKSGLSEWALNQILDNYSFKKMSKGRKVGEENTDSHYRKGKAGDWRNHFSERHKDLFKEKYGRLLIKLGYERDDNW